MNTALRIFAITIIALIIVNVICVIVDTFSPLPELIVRALQIIEIVSVSIFTAEYILRLWISDLQYKNVVIISRIRYLFSFMAIVDLLAILPFYLPLFFMVDLRVLRMLRLLRITRVIKLGRYGSAFKTISTALRKSASQLVSAMAIVIFIMVLLSVIMYYVENVAQPKVFRNAFSGLWWAVATLTTVGYGDIYPITVFGKTISGAIALFGIGLVAIPTGIISAAFMDELKNKED